MRIDRVLPGDHSKPQKMILSTTAKFGWILTEFRTHLVVLISVVLCSGFKTSEIPFILNTRFFSPSVLLSLLNPETQLTLNGKNPCNFCLDNIKHFLLNVYIGLRQEG